MDLSNLNKRRNNDEIASSLKQSIPIIKKHPIHSSESLVKASTKTQN